MADLVPRLWEMSKAPGQHVEDRAVWAAAAAHIAGLRAERDRLREALVDLLETAEAIAVYPEGAVGFESLAEAEQHARDALGPEGEPSDRELLDGFLASTEPVGPDEFVDEASGPKEER